MKLIKNDKLECQIADVAEGLVICARGWGRTKRRKYFVNVTTMSIDEEKVLPAISVDTRYPKSDNASKGISFLRQARTGVQRRLFRDRWKIWRRSGISDTAL